jgi:hypothetical protein
MEVADVVKPFRWRSKAVSTNYIKQQGGEQSGLAAIREETITRGKRIYEESLREVLEPENTGRYVAIEPKTGNYFLGDTSAEALGSAHDALPESHFYLVRIGHSAAHTIGGHAIRRR